MSDKSRTIISAAALTLGFAALCAIIVLTVVHAVGTDSALYYSEQLKAGVSEANLIELDQRLAHYLKGHRAALENRAPFNAREMAHLADCFNLFTLLRRVRAALMPCAIALILGGAWLLRDRRRIRRCVCLAPLLLLVPLGGFAVYALVDFDAAFVTFHHILFSNDLWLLNPETDLLIRICPESMFMAMGVRIAVYSVIGIGAAVAGVVAVTHFWPKAGQDA